MTTFADCYAAARAHRIVVDGRLVFGMFTISVARAFTLKFVRSVPEPPQGVRISAKRPMEVLGVRSTAFALWHEDGEDYRIESLARQPQTVQVSTVWRSDRGTIHTWFGNYGMLVKRDEHTVSFACSNGPGERTFEDLEFIIEGVEDTEPTA